MSVGVVVTALLAVGAWVGAVLAYRWRCEAEAHARRAFTLVDDWSDDVPPADRMAQVENAKRVPGMVWLGDLSGFEIAGPAVLTHRCGWADVPNTPMYLANIVERAMVESGGHVCPTRELSAETAAMIERATRRER